MGDLDLSGVQQKLHESLKECVKPLSIQWIAANAGAMLETFNSGMLGGKAAANILTLAGLDFYRKLVEYEKKNPF